MVTPERALRGRDHYEFAVPDTHYVTGRSIKAPFPEGYQQAVFGLGCFWGAEEVFWQLPGVWTTAVGYTGGITAAPRLRGGVLGLTGHTEAVLVVFDPDQVSYAQIVATFFEVHDPTQGMRQGNDVGTQYRSGIYYTDDAQREVAEQAKKLFGDTLAELGYGAVTTEIAPLGEFYYAEGYHQQYLAKNPNGYRCHSTTGVTFPLAELGLVAADARAARGRGARDLPARARGRAHHRAGRRRRHQRGEDVRPAADRAARRDRHRRRPARQVPRPRDRLADGRDPAPGRPSGPRRLAAVARVAAAGAAAAGRQGADRVPAAPGARSCPTARSPASTSPRPAPRSGWPSTSSATRSTSPASPASGPDALAVSRDELGGAARRRSARSSSGRSPTRRCSPASATPTPTRSCTPRGCRRSRTRPSSPRTSSTRLHDAMRTVLHRRRRALGRAEGGDAEVGEAQRPAGARPHRPAVPGLRRHGARGVLRRPQLPVLPDLPDRGPRARRPPPVATDQVIVIASRPSGAIGSAVHPAQIPTVAVDNLPADVAAAPSRPARRPRGRRVGGRAHRRRGARADEPAAAAAAVRPRSAHRRPRRSSSSARSAAARRRSPPGCATTASTPRNLEGGMLAWAAARRPMRSTRRRPGARRLIPLDLRIM